MNGDFDAGDRRRQDRALFDRYVASGEPGERDPVLRAELTTRFLPLARQLARRYQGSEEPLDDLVQVASLGLVKAIERFSPEREIAFSSYAVPTILGELKRHFRDRTWSVRVPRDLQELTLKVDRVITALSHDLQRSPSVDEIAEAVGADEEQVLEALAASSAYRATSLDAPRGAEGDDGAALVELLGDDDDQFDRAEDRATLQRILRAASPREREVLRLRFVEDLTQSEIGELIGVSQMQVSRVIRQCLVRLRAAARVEDAEGAAD